MLTAILLAYSSPAAPLRRDAVARSLASLVDSCVQGLVADAVLAGAPGAGLDRIADEAGCALVESAAAAEGLAQALAIARRDHVFLLAAGAAVERGFVDEINDAFAYGAQDRAMVLRLAPHSLLTRMAPNFSEAVGVIAPRAAVRAGGGADLARLSKRLRCAELTCRARRTF
ncbi:MAG: transposase [Methylocystis sp.]|uniref:transposase n=1 Tax=Methylocystis sp. TaxID=1911079 RepID=UPI003DA56E31